MKDSKKSTNFFLNLNELQTLNRTVNNELITSQSLKLHNKTANLINEYLFEALIRCINF